MIAQIRKGDYLTADYPDTADALFEKYHPIEIDDRLTLAEKCTAMDKWWMEHFELLFKSGLNKQVMQTIVAKRTLKLRNLVIDFIKFLNQYHIPLVIMSVTIGDMLEMYLQQDKVLLDNVFIISNFLIFDAQGNAVDVEKPIVHSMNKFETLVKDFPVFDKIKNRKNVLLLGYAPEDVGMIKGFDYNALIKIGFLNVQQESRLDIFKQHYDVVIVNDADFDYVNKLTKQLLT